MDDASVFAAFCCAPRKEGCSHCALIEIDASPLGTSGETSTGISDVLLDQPAGGDDASVDLQVNCVGPLGAYREGYLPRHSVPPHKARCAGRIIKNGVLVSKWPMNTGAFVRMVVIVKT